MALKKFNANYKLLPLGQGQCRDQVRVLNGRNDPYNLHGIPQKTILIKHIPRRDAMPCVSTANQKRRLQICNGGCSTDAMPGVRAMIAKKKI